MKVTTYGEAVQDPTTRLGAEAARLQAERERVVAQWMDRGYTMEEAFKAALFGFRKEQ